MLAFELVVKLESVEECKDWLENQDCLTVEYTHQSPRACANTGLCTFRITPYTESNTATKFSQFVLQLMSQGFHPEG